MYLKSIRANGFKSFADKITIALDDNITCVVGPNGSGKSNIVDAIRWVLGEQSVKSLRGTNAMSDIIFAGSKSRAAASRAEVSLVFDNSDHYLHSEFSDIEVKRILYRSGESEYFINNSRVRLKDITDLFLDSGAGNDSFNIIGQGNIETVVNSKPIERRVIFEEAAGVLKYKKRKEESLKKLEKTRENIEKVMLVIDELESSLAPLKEQSEKAKKYLDLKEELKEIEIATITHDITLMNQEYGKLKKEIDTLNNQLLDIDTTNSDEVTKLEDLKLKNIQIDEKMNIANSRLLDITQKFANLQNEKMMYTERKKFSGDTESVQNNIVTLKENILELDKTIQVLNNEILNFEATLKKEEHQLADINEEESFNKMKRSSLNNQYQANIKSIFELKNKMEIIENNIENDSKLPFAVKSILNNIRLTGVYQTIGKLLKVDEAYTTAIDVALGASANFLVVDTENTAKECIEYLKENKLGRATFFPLSIIKARFIPNDVRERLESIDGYLGIASDLVSYDDKFDSIIQNQLGQIVVVKNIDVLNMIARILDYKYRVVSLDGEIMHAGGSITGGVQKNANSSLKDKANLANFARELEQKETENANVSKAITEMDTEMQVLREKEENIHRTIINLKESLLEKNKILESKKQNQAELNKELEGSLAIDTGAVDDKLIALMSEVTEAETQKNIIAANLEQLKNEKNDMSTMIDELEKKYREKNSNYNRIQNDLKAKEVSLGKMDIKLDNLLLNLNENYNLTYEKAKLDYLLEEDVTEAKLKVTNLKNAIAHLGEVNVYAIEEYERISTRYDFLNNQKNDLETASLQLTDVISEMDTIMVDKFQEAFSKISKEFQTIFRKLFKGGHGELVLTDPEHILETGIDIIAEPPGKKLNNIGLLSGGEKTLTAISLLFAILNVKTVPFCVLDEVEAALDEANVDAFGKYLQENKENSQFILITHKKRTMEYADILYGITMQESGVSKIVSVKLENE